MSFLSFIKKLFKEREYIYHTPLTPDQCKRALDHQFGKSEYRWLRGRTSSQGFCLWANREESDILLRKSIDLHLREFEACYTIDSYGTTIIKGHFKQFPLPKILFVFINLFSVSSYVEHLTASPQNCNQEFNQLGPFVPLIFFVISILVLVGFERFGKGEDHCIIEVIESSLVGVDRPNRYID